MTIENFETYEMGNHKTKFCLSGLDHNIPLYHHYCHYFLDRILFHHNFIMIVVTIIGIFMAIN